ncbi:MAG: calcium-binding protein, partial [Paracoccaceae bacterium]
GDGADSLSGSAQNDMIYGGDDDDVLEGGAGADSLFGGGGQDQVSYENSDVGVIFTPTGAPSEFIGQGGHAEGDILSEIEVLIGSDFGDEFVGNPNESNIIDGGRGSDTITGGTEDDLLLGAQGGDTIDGGAGTDQTSYIFSLGGVTVNLSTGLAFGGHATGDDLTSIESVQGTFYADKLTTSGNDGALDGSNGDDTLRSMGGRVSLFGGGGDDIVYADGDAFGDELSGGGFYNLRPGRDLLSYRFADNGVNVDLFNGQAEAIGVPFSSPDAIAGTEMVLAPPGQAGEVIGPALGYSSFEDLEGSNDNDTLIGDNRGNSILGLSGNDTLGGGDGDDTLIGGSGADSLAGGNGSDWADYRDSFSGVTVTLGEGGFSGAGAGGSATGDTLVSDIENIFGSSRADTLTGNSDANRINPGIAISGADSVDGLGGDDTLVLSYGDLYSAIGINQAAGEGFVFGATALTYTDIERLNLDGTAFNDIVILDDFTDDRLFLRGGDDIIGAGGGNDIVLAGPGNDVISHFGRITETSQDLPTLWIDGGEDIDTLNIDLALATEAVELAMGSPLVENPDQAEFIGTEVAITRIEIIGDVTTGIGNFDDTLIQPGDFDNVFLTFDGDDVIAPGLGSDTIIAGERPDNARGTDVDLLILDYSEAVLDHVVSSFEIDIDQSFGGYAGIDVTGQQTSDFVFFQDVERLFVTGTDGSDIMFGASDPEYDGPGDLLIGLAGGDTLYGGLADDTLIAGIVGGDDIIDVVYGGDGADLFVLGDETGYFYGEPSVNPPDNRDGIIIHDFDDTEGDVIQLVGSADEYAVTEFLGASFLLRGTLGDPVVDAILINYTGFDLTADYVTYVQETQAVSQSFASVEDTLSEIDQLFAELGLDLPSAAELLSSAQPDAADLAADIRDGSLAGPAVFEALRAAAEAPAPEVQASVDTDAPLVLETTGNEASVLAGIIQAQIQQVANGLNSDIVLDITTFGDPTGFAQLREGFGFQGGLAISTGVAEEQAGPNLADGSIVTFEASQQLVELEAVGVVGNSQIFRADVTGLDITQLTLTDANILQGGTGRVTGSDIDTLFFSNELFEGDSAADFAVLPKLDVLNFTPAGSILELGPQRGGTIPGVELVGTLAGFLDNSVATEDVRDGTASATTNSFSTGDGGRATFLLDQPLLAGDTPTYLYVAETGAFEGLFLEVANDPASQQAGAAGDLNTDFGLPGTDGDHLGFDISLSPFIETLNGQVIEVELFQIVVTFESLLELAGPDLQDRFRVTVNGFDALVLRDGTAAVLENLALSPFGAFHPDLHQNPVGTGPMADRLRADAFTAVLTVRAPIVIGEQNTIRIEVEDRGDGLLDTAMFIASPQIEDTLADTVALFEEPSDTAPLGIFNTVEQAMSEARTGDLIRVGADTSSNPEPDGPVLVTANQLTFEANTPLPEGLQLGDSVDELTLEGAADVDVIGGIGNDTIIGNAGDNTIDGGLGDDDAFGGAGEDTLTFATLEAPSLVVGEAEFGVFVDLSDQGNRQDTGAGLDLFRGFQNVEGSEFADLLTGDRQDNVLHGNDGGDLLFGNEGDDELFGGDGFDALEGGPGADSLFGGDSVGDIATYFAATEPLVFVFGETLTQFRSGTSAQIAEDTIGEDIEGFAGSNIVSNTFDASAVRELTFFLGGAQDDTFFGGSGTDQLIGLGGNDVMYGNDGSDGLIGEGQNDDYYGGADADFFFFDGQDGDDTIHDLELGLDSIFFFGDLIEDLSQLTFSATDADGDGQQDDSMITYEAAGEQSSISAVGIEVVELQTEAIILFG